jgi:RNA polymerase sigma-70 factor (ECF subfamily)
MTDAEFREAFHLHQNVVYRFAYRMTGSSSAAEDVVQDCFVTFWRKPEGYLPHRGALRAYLLGMARNLILKRWRRDRHHEPIEDWMEDQAFLCAPPDLAALERAEAVRRAVLMLPPLQREALILAEYEELSLEEMAAATGAEIAAMKSRLHRARGNLRQMLSPLFAMER